MGEDKCPCGNVDKVGRICVMPGVYNHLQVVPEKGEIVFCDFSNFASPEMIKYRPCVVVSPNMKYRPKICTIIPLSTTMPIPCRNYHCEIDIIPVLRKPYDSPSAWVKGDMLYTVSINRLDRPYDFSKTGKRIFYKQSVSQADMLKIEKAILAGLGISL